MRVLLLGGNGAIGKRYQAILKSLGARYEVADNPEGVVLEHYKFDKLLIATPTPTHSKYVIDCMRMGKPFLCEKPISETVETAQELQQISDNLNIQGSIVCNWKILAEDIVLCEKPFRIKYDYYYSGAEDMKWNMAQVIYLDTWAEIYTQSPRWNVKINGKEIRYRALEQSYVVMIRKWLEGDTGKLWNMKDGVEMVKTCIEWDQRHGARYKA